MDTQIPLVYFPSATKNLSLPNGPKCLPKLTEWSKMLTKILVLLTKSESMIILSSTIRKSTQDTAPSPPHECFPPQRKNSQRPHRTQRPSRLN